MKERVPDPRSVGNYAGAFSRLASYVVDAVVVSVVFSGGTAMILWIVQLVTAHNVETTGVGTVGSSVLFGVWFLLYFGVLWAVTGRTVGMAVLGVRVVRRDGSDLNGRRAAVRAITFPLSFLFFGLGFVGVVVGRERRALHDVCADTTVVYDWEVQALKLRRLARQHAVANRDPATS